MKKVEYENKVMNERKVARTIKSTNKHKGAETIIM